MTRPLAVFALVVGLLTGVDAWVEGYDTTASIFTCLGAQLILAAALVVARASPRRTSNGTRRHRLQP